MARRAPTLDLGAILTSARQSAHPADEWTDAVLDATSALMQRYGMRRWSMDDVAEQAGVGRATLYRRFDGRDDLVQATLARDVRRFFGAISDAVESLPYIDDKVLEGFLVGLRLVRGSLISALIESEPAAAISLLRDKRVLALARTSLVERYQSMTGRRLSPAERGDTELVAEALLRLGVSFVLLEDSVVDFSDIEVSRRALGRLIRPLLDRTERRG